MEPPVLAAFIRESFYPAVLAASDVSFVTEQGIVPPSGPFPSKEILFRLIDKKNAFEWQQGVLTSWDGTTMKLLVNGQPRQFQLARTHLFISASRMSGFRCGRARGSVEN